MTPNSKIRFRLFPFLSLILRKSLLFSFPLVTEMFYFTRFPTFITFTILNKFKIKLFPNSDICVS